jgi:hypothetical protein
MIFFRLTRQMAKKLLTIAEANSAEPANPRWSDREADVKLSRWPAYNICVFCSHTFYHDDAGRHEFEPPER